MKRLLIIVFIITILAQWFIPVTTIFRKQKVLKDGKTYHFKARPLDPEHPFKGRYLIMSFDEENFRIDSSLKFDYGAKAYALIETGPDNMANLYSLSLNRPEPGTDYLEVEVQYVNYLDDAPIANLKFPFREYYLKESNATKAEAIYFRSASDTNSVTSAVVKIHNGESVLTGIKIGAKDLQNLLSE